MKRQLLIVTLALLSVLAGIPDQPQAQMAQEITWIHQFGTTAGDFANDVAVDRADNVYVVGRTGGTLPNQISAGDEDAFIRKYDAAGNELWTRQFNITYQDQAWGVAVDSANNAYVVGITLSIRGETSYDVFLRKYDPNGSELWTRQFGTTNSDFARAVEVDSLDNVYVTGSTSGPQAEGEDAILLKYDTNGNLLWTRQFSTPSVFGTHSIDQAYAVAADGVSGAVAVAGTTAGAFPGHSQLGSGDAFIRLYDTDGNELWTRQFGTTALDVALGVAFDPVTSAVVVTGYTIGAGAFVRKYDQAGNLLWTQQYPGLGDGIAVDAVGSVYVSSAIDDAVSNATHFQVRKFDTAGVEVWVQTFDATERQFSNADEMPGVAVDSRGGVYAVGSTSGALLGQSNSGNFDAFIVQITQATADSIAPDTSVISAVDGNGVTVPVDDSTVATSITFTFTGSDDVGVASFECRLDGSDFAACTSPVSYFGLATGTYEFEVRAIDTSDNIDATPATFTWTILTPAEGVESLIDTVDDLPLSGGLKTSLKASLNNALKKLFDDQPQNDTAACASLNDFMAQVNDLLTAGKLTPDQAETLTQAALAIKAAQGCP